MSSEIPDASEAIDDLTPPPRRTPRELLREAVLLVPNVIRLLVGLVMDPRVSMRRKALLFAVLVYVVSPIDLIPDFVIGLGHLDDLVLAALAIDHLIRGVDEAIVLDHWDGSIDGLDLVRSAFTWGAEIVPSVVSRMLPR